MGTFSLNYAISDVSLYFLSQIKLPPTMCFLKFIPATTPTPSLSNDSFGLPPSPSCFSQPSPFSFLQHPSKEKDGCSPMEMAMLGCLKMLALNSQAITALDQKLSHSDALLTFSNQLASTAHKTLDKNHSSEHLHQGEETAEQGMAASDPLTVQLFGQQTYKYRLVLASSFPDTLYKDRNFGFSFKLINISSGLPENNGNLISVCLGVCDSKGEWVGQTKEGGPMLKGKLDGELYHGQGEFAKVAPRDVSRGFDGKKVTLVVYAKPSVLQYSGESSLERRVDHRLIEPLLVKDVIIKAKRRD